MAVKRSSESPGTRGNAEPPRTGSPVAAVLLTAFGVLVIAACAVLLSYNGIYQIAVQGNIDERYAHLYPASFTLLVLMALWTSYVLRTAPRSRRLWADALILALIALAAGASALRSADLVLVPDVALVVAAVAPWVALLVAFRLFLWVVMHLRGEVPGTRPRSHPPRQEPRQRGAEEEPRTEAAPAAVTRQQDTQPLGELLSAESRPAVPELAHPRERDEDERPPRPREPEPADFREPGLHTPRPEPGERPTRPEHPGRPYPPEHPEPPESAEPEEAAERAEPGEPPESAESAGERKRPGFLRRAVGGAGAKRRRGSHAPERPAPAEGTAEASDPADAVDAEHSAPAGPATGTDTDTTAPLWPNATSQPADSETASGKEDADSEPAEHEAAQPPAAAAAALPRLADAPTRSEADQRPGDRPAAAGADTVRANPAERADAADVPDAGTADQTGDDAVAEPAGPGTGRPSSDEAAGAVGAADADPSGSPRAPGATDAAAAADSATEPGAPEDAVADTRSAAPARRTDGDAEQAAPERRTVPDEGVPAPVPAPNTPGAAEPDGSSAAEAPEPSGAPSVDAALPKRTPGAAENPIKRAADTAPTAADADTTGSADTAGPASREPTDTGADATAVRPDASEDGDGFVDDLPPGDPTSDEAEPAAAARELSAPAAADGDGDAVLDRLAPDTDPHEPPQGPAYPAAPPIEKRPMVLKPRRSPRPGTMSPFPEEPPSNRVRSEPKPPEE